MKTLTTKLKVGDLVQVIAGAEKGASGKILRFVKNTERVVVDGVNTTTRNKKAGRGEVGSREEFYAPIHVSNVAVLDPKSNMATRLGYRTEGGLKVRVALKSGVEITGLSEVAPKNDTK